MKNITSKFTKISFCPYKTDYLYKTIAYFSKNNPVYTGLIYFLISYVPLYIIGYLTGQLHGKNGLLPMYDVNSIADNINIGFLAPAGAGLLCYLYNTIENTYNSVLKEGILKEKDHDQYVRYLNKLDRIYNNFYIYFFSIILSISINWYNYFAKKDSWLGINGGITGAYGRMFIFFNFTIIFLFIYKCIITIWSIQKTLSFDIIIRPLHPDRSGGLKPLGQLALATNYFIVLILIFLTLLMIFDPLAREQKIYLTMIFLFYVFSPFSMFLSLSKAHKRMREQKYKVLSNLSISFDYYYDLLVKNSKNGVYVAQDAENVSQISDLYEIADRMPIWPFDAKTTARFFTTIAIPFTAFVLNLVGGPEGIKGLLLSIIK
ncbi:MAG: hypothetical protein JXC36_04600 [Candidatus Atribacteria bacterium]|nr:hypothetical protein [Candidatus Atribacteria bacterium]